MKIDPLGKLPQTTTKREKEISAKLSADLIAKIGKPSLEAAYKSKVDDAYAQLSQKNLEQLVLLEFLICIKRHHSKDVSPETVSTMERAIQAAIARATGAESLRGQLSSGSKERLEETVYGAEKLAAVQS